jgi:hypothetical protein
MNFINLFNLPGFPLSTFCSAFLFLLLVQYNSIGEFWSFVESLPLAIFHSLIFFVETSLIRKIESAPLRLPEKQRKVPFGERLA